MRIQSYLSLLIICEIFLQGIAVISDENIVNLSDNSTDLHIRKKRVINGTPGGNVPVLDQSRFPFIVNILRNGVPHCGGTILESDVILTSNTCIMADSHQFSVFSGSPMKHAGRPHIITSRIFISAVNHLVIFKIFPPIHLGGYNRKIRLWHGHLPRGVYGSFAGWGCTSRGPQWDDIIYPNELMKARLPAIPLNECIQRYYAHLDDRNMCTLDVSRRRGACLGDQGGPLVYSNRLIGVLLHAGMNVGINPDIYININEPTINQWVTQMRDSLRQ